jgi:predicted molibdopterin-dependent oxidoreductase YjgC
MFRRLETTGRVDTVTVTVCGKPVILPRGETAAAALVAAGAATGRTTPVTGAPRGPYCMMGVCFDCLVMIDGAPNRQACMTEIREGMRIERQDGARRIGR